jgi:hypothetical protein
VITGDAEAGFAGVIESKVGSVGNEATDTDAEVRLSVTLSGQQASFAGAVG